MAGMADHDFGHLISDVLDRCHHLLGEIDELQSFISSRSKRYLPIELRKFQNSIIADMEHVKKLSNPSEFSPNLSFYESVFATMKSCRGVKALTHRFYWETPARGLRQRNPIVDIVAQDGLEWVKIYSSTEKRMILEMASSGLVWNDSDESGSEDMAMDDDDDDDEGLLKIAKLLLKTSRVNRVKYQCPKIRIVLTRITRGSVKEIDKFLDRISAMGIRVQTAEEIAPAPALSKCLHLVPVDRWAGFTETLNLDCTILITLVSDLSHANVSPEDWQSKNVRQQIELEKGELLLPTTLWPIFSSKALVCTTIAAQKLQEIVDTMGTETEGLRTKLLIGPSQLTREQRIEEFQKLSTYKVPKEWQLPLSVVDIDIQSNVSGLPTRSAEVLYKTLYEPNRSVFFHGWISGNTTITTNGVACKEIERTVEENRDSEEDSGPPVWLFPSPRSLVGRKRQGPQKKEKVEFTEDVEDI